MRKRKRMIPMKYESKNEGIETDMSKGWNKEKKEVSKNATTTR